MSPDHFDGKRAIVTGAASGIGREIARQLANRGATVLATDLWSTPIDDVVEAIRAEGGDCTAMAVDVTSRDDLSAAIAAMVDGHGGLDLMFNNAGVAIFGEFDLVTLDDWDRIIDVNLRGVAHGTTLAYQQMVKQGAGHIINTASAAGLVPVPLQAHYCATKQAVIGMSRTLALEAREHGIDVSVFCPAWVESGMFDNHTIRGSLEGVDARRLVPVAPLPTDVAVGRLLDGVRRGRQTIITPAYGRLGWWLERLSPTVSQLVHRQTLKQLRARARRHA